MSAEYPLLFVHVQQQNGRHTTHEVDLGGPYWIGRDASCNLVLDSPDVSRRHARLIEHDRSLYIEDLSANGTLVGQTRIQKTRHPLPIDTPLHIGPFDLYVRSRPRLEEHISNPSAPKALDTGARWQDEPAKLSTHLRRLIHRKLLDHLDLARLDQAEMLPDALRPRVLEALQRIVADGNDQLPPHINRHRLVLDLCNEVLGLGPLEQLLAAADVSEIMVVDPRTIFVERNGIVEPTGLRFIDDVSVRGVIERIVTPLGRRIDESTPLVDARLKDGSRVNAIIPPLSIKGPCITIRKFSNKTLSMDDLIAVGSMDTRMARLLTRCVGARKNVVISGGTGSGKTTLLNVLARAIPEAERVVTIEDAAELRLGQPHVVSLETRPANMEGKGAVSIRDLVRNALRMRPDRIVVGECRGGEALDMLQAMNTGHEGSMTTIHANSPYDAMGRLETLCLMAGLDLPIQAIRNQIAASVHVIIQQLRFPDGTRRVASIAEIVGMDERGELILHELLGYRPPEEGASDRKSGGFFATGYMPSFADQLIAKGLVIDGEIL